ncbi:MAG TPA: CvpA family protein [Herpetosiphonaceae bacterium]
MFVDLLLLFGFIVITAVGFFQGTIKIVLALVTFYASVILASLYFKFASLYMVRRGTSAVVADAISFFLILVICFILLLAAALYTFRYVRFPGRLEFVDRIIGVMLGVILGVVFMSIVGMVLQFLFISNSIGDPYPITRSLQNSTRTSTLLPLLINNILPQVFSLVAPFLPESALPFFRPR